MVQYGNTSNDLEDVACYLKSSLCQIHLIGDFFVLKMRKKKVKFVFNSVVSVCFVVGIGANGLQKIEIKIEFVLTIFSCSLMMEYFIHQWSTMDLVMTC